jgi:hypothetical protein
VQRSASTVAFIRLSPPLFHLWFGSLSYN